MKNYDYSNIKSVEELKSIYNIVEETKEETNDDIKIISERQEDDGFFFKNILFFTNDRDPKTNKTLKNLEQAVKNKNVEIFPFVADEINYKATDDMIEWYDNESKYKIDEQSNIDTIVITRLGIQDSEECMELVHELQDRF